MGPRLVGALYALLLGAAALVLGVRRFPNAFPPALEQAAPWVFGVFILGFAAYRLALVRDGKYPAGKAFLQVGAFILFMMLLFPTMRLPRLPQPGAEETGPTNAVKISELIHDRDPRVRLLAAEVARHRRYEKDNCRALAQALTDHEGAVAEEAHQSLISLVGKDYGASNDAAAQKRWLDGCP